MMMKPKLGEELPAEVFQGWVYQSINRAIIFRLQAIADDVRLSRQVRASYVTEFSFRSPPSSECPTRPWTVRKRRTQSIS